MKRFFRIIIICIVIVIITFIILYQLRINKFCENINEIYGDDIRIISVERNFKTGEYYALATYPPDGTIFNIYEDGFNSYKHDYWSGYMKEIADKSVDNLFDGNAYCSKVMLYSYYTKESPVNGTMTYHDYLNKYADINQTYIIYKIEKNYSESYLDEFHKLFSNLSETDLRYDQITIFFKDCNFKISFENVMDLSENFDYSLLKNMKGKYGMNSFD